MPPPRLMFYHDGRHPLIYMYEPPMQPEEYEAAVDELVGTPVQALMFCLGDGRTVLHDSRVGERWGHNVRRWPHLVFRRAAVNAGHLIRQGHDPLRLVCDRAHAKGMQFYATLLVQQGRGRRGEDVRCSEFRFTHAHLEIGSGGDLPADVPGATCLDFAHEEVRQERLALIRETLERYPVDGLELQLNYVPWYFHPRRVRAGRRIMTEWIAQVHRAVKASGAERQLVLRVPASLPGCLAVGLDVRAWLAAGIVDVLVGQTLSGPELLDATADLRPLVRAARGSRCRVHAALHSHVDSDRLGEACIEMVRAAACNYWRQGVDGLYLAHWFGNWPYQAAFYEKLRELADPEVMAARDKHYFVPTQTSRYPQPQTEPGLRLQLPAALRPGRPVAVRLPVSDDLRRWRRVGRVHRVLLRVRVMNTTEADRLRVELNRRPLPARRRRRIDETYRMSAPRYRTGSGCWLVYTLDPDHWPRRGANTVGVLLQRRDPSAEPPVTLRDVELEIAYLRGRSAARGQDPDLGPYERSME